MDISIEYCGVCNYRPMAASLAKVIEQATGVKPVLVHSRVMGALEVKVDGELIFSKVETGYFPDNDKVVEIIRNRK